MFQSQNPSGLKPLTNAALMAELVEELNHRPFGIPGFGVFHGPYGYGKTCAAGFAANMHDAAHVPYIYGYSILHYLRKIVEAMKLPPLRRSATKGDYIDALTDALRSSGTILLLDEIDLIVGQKGFMQTIRAIGDNSQATIIMIGTDEVPQRLKAHGALSSRCVWRAAQPADLTDARMLSEYYAGDIVIEDDLLEIVVTRCTGSARLISKELIALQNWAISHDLQAVDAEAAGHIDFSSGSEAPIPRRGLKI